MVALAETTSALTTIPELCTVPEPRCMRLGHVGEVIVGIRGTVLDVAPSEVLQTSEPQCEDCPDINPNPPKDSLCDNFDTSNGFPVCTRDGNTDELIRNWLNS